MYTVHCSSPAIAAAIHAETAEEALEIARPHHDAGRNPTIEKDGLIYSFKELERAVESSRFGGDA